MATLQIPTNFDFPAFSLAVELDSEVYDMTFRINRRDNAWRMDISVDGGVLIRGVRLVTGFDLLARYRYIARMPQGTLRLVDLDLNDADPSEETFGDRVVLVYDEAA